MAQKEKRKAEWPRGLYVRDGIFRLRKMAKGKKINVTLGELAESEAIAKAYEIINEIKQGHISKAKAKANHVTFQEVAFKWLDSKDRLKDRSISKYTSIIKSFQNWLEINGKQNDSVSVISASDCQDYGTYLTKIGQEKGDKISLLSQIFDWLINREEITKNPFNAVEHKKKRGKERKEKHRYFSKDEIAGLLETAKVIDSKRDDAHNGKSGNAKWYDILYTAFYTGLRENELRLLEWTDIDFERSFITVNSKEITETRSIPIPDKAITYIKKLTKNRDKEDMLFNNESEISKCHRLDIRENKWLQEIKIKDVDLDKNIITVTRRYRESRKGSEGIVPLDQPVIDHLHSIKKKRPSTQFVFEHCDGGSCRLKMYELIIRTQKEYIEKLPEKEKRQFKIGRLHDTRHSFAKLCLKNGMPLEVLKEVLRHSDIRDTLIYVDVDPSDMVKYIKGIV